MARAPQRTILLTGASGYVGGRLLRRLEADGHSVRCLARRPDVLKARVGPDTDIVQADVLDPGSLGTALADVHTAYYLVHSMGGQSDFEELDRRGALNFATAARAAGVTQIIYLGGLGRDDDLSPHLASRHEVGRLLRCTGVATIELRASIVIGSGSASFETVRALVDHLPVIVAPRWVETLSQPIAVEDVVDRLFTAAELDAPVDAVCEIGGEDQVTYAEVMREYSRQRGLRRRVVRAPLLTPRISRLMLGLITPVYGRVAAAMVESLRNETIVTERPALETLARPGRGVSEAIERALVNEDQEFAQTRWSDALGSRPPARWGGLPVGPRRVSSRAVRVDADPTEAFAAIQSIGGANGWYAADRFWSLRGLLDTLRGGVGLRRGRRDPVDLRVGDAVDFWRVERFEAGRLLRLAAEMRIPGRLWLQFEVDSGEDRAIVSQTTIFDPAGWVGHLYWYALYPVHRRVFAAMLRGIQKAVLDRSTVLPSRSSSALRQPGGRVQERPRAATWPSTRRPSRHRRARP